MIMNSLIIRGHILVYVSQSRRISQSKQYKLFPLLDVLGIDAEFRKWNSTDCLEKI